MVSKKKFFENIEIIIYQILLCIISWYSLLPMIFGSIFFAIQESNIKILIGTLSYFSIQTNILIALWLTFSLIYINKDPISLYPSIFGGLTVYASFTFLVFLVILQPLQQFIIIDINHYFIPGFFIIYWFYITPKNKYKKVYALYWLIYPTLYLVYIFIRGILTNIFPYPFLDLNLISPFLYFINNFLILGMFYLLGRLFIFINQKKYNKLEIIE